MDIQKLHEIFNWIGNKELYKTGVTNKQVIERFGITYKDAWTKLKARKKAMFYEDGKWYRWQ